jgi:hypothetical protein
MAHATTDRKLTLELTEGEVEGLRALAHGIGVLREREVSEADAVVSAAELGLARLLDDYDLPADDRVRVEQGLERMRTPWVRGNCCL